MKRISAQAIALLGVFILCGMFAEGTPAATVQQLVDTRVAAMKQNGQIIRSAKNLSGDRAVQAATTVLKNFKAFPGLFPEGSLTPDSRATDKIWKNWADFLKRMKAEEGSAQDMLAAAKAGDSQKYEAAIDKLRSRCSSCHLTYAR